MMTIKREPATKRGWRTMSVTIVRKAPLWLKRKNDLSMIVSGRFSALLWDGSRGWEEERSWLVEGFAGGDKVVILRFFFFFF
jgi:hypothetical protein